MKTLPWCFGIVSGTCLLIAGSGCRQANAPKPLPADYRTLAKHLGHELRTSKQAFQDDKDITAIITEGHSVVMDLKGIQSADADLTYLAVHGQSAFADAVNRMERINSLPKPQSAKNLFVESFIHGLYGNIYAGYALGVEADNKQKAIVVELQGLFAAVEKAEALHLLLPKVAEKYAAPMGSNSKRVQVDFDETWGAFGPYDWLGLQNRGSELEDCTVLVELTGVKGEVRKHVHFLPKWASASWVYARYDSGHDFMGKKVGRMTVPNVDTVDITIWSPTFSEKLHYVYQGAEKDKDVAERCKDLKLICRYQPFKPGLLQDKQRGAHLTLDGIAFLPKCRIHLTFRQGDQAKSWSWDLESWKNGEEKSFVTSKGELTFNPEDIDVVITFPGTRYECAKTLAVSR